jgi:hypothetical protein
MFLKGKPCQGLDRILYWSLGQVCKYFALQKLIWPNMLYLTLSLFVLSLNTYHTLKLLLLLQLLHVLL